MSPKIIVKSPVLINGKTSQLELIDLLLKNRGIGDGDVASFLNPTNPKQLKPEDFSVLQPELKKAVKRIKDAVKDGEDILIYGDYDVDGITATAILWQTLHKIGAKVVPFVPDREHDGYGVKAKSVFDFQKEKNLSFRLLITVDNGIVAHDEISKITQSGIDVIVTDHHLPLEKYPEAFAVVHTVKISGAAVSWLLALQLDPEADIGLAALGTVADCMPLTGVNRNLVVHGLQNLRLNPNFGLRHLIQVSGIRQESLSAFDLGYVLGPRINAVGRLSNPTDALRLLCSSNSLQADKYAKISNEHNQNRQLLQQNGLELANKMLVDNKDKLIFVQEESFQLGIIGLIAGRLTEKYYLPSIVISVGPDVSKGSCRSIKELNIIEALRQCSDLLLEAGGHAEAAGFSVETQKIAEFKAAITKIINQKLADTELQPHIEVESEMKLSAVTTENCRTIKKLEPFGVDNPDPLFLFRKVRITQKQLVGSQGDHLKLKLDDPATSENENVRAYRIFNSVNAIAFRKGELDAQIKTGALVDIVAKLDINVWNGNEHPQLIVKDILFDNPAI